jgi:tape measure domain-containing protein
MTDIASLGVRVTSDGIEDTSRRLDSMGRFAAAAEKQLELLGRIANAVERQIEMLGGAAAVSASQSSALGAAAAASTAGISSMGAAAAVSTASVGGLGAAAVASAAAVAGAGKGLVTYAGGTNLLTSANTSLVSSINRSGSSLNGYGDNILRIGHTTTLSAGAMEKFGQAANAPRGALLALARANETASAATLNFAKNYGGMVLAVGAAAIGLAARGVSDYTDRMASMQGQLRLVTEDQIELNQVYGRALALANETGQSVEATVNLYAKLARSTQELNLSQDQLFAVTKAINQAFVVSGATATESAAAMHQLSQGLASGTLRGEELNSVMENSPRIARALAEGLGVSIGQLRQMGADGELTAEKVTRALELMSGSINAEFQQMPMTIGRASQEIKNNLLDAFGAADTGPAIQAIKEFNEALADPATKRNLKDLASLSIDAGTGVAALTLKLLALAATPFTKIGEGVSGLVDKLRGLGLLRDNLDDLGVIATGNIQEMQAALDQLKGFKQTDEVKARVLALESALASAKNGTVNVAAAMADYDTRLKAADASINKTSDDLTRVYARAMATAEDRNDKARAAIQDMNKALEFQIANLKASGLQQAINTAVQKAHEVAIKNGTTATAAEIEQIRSKTAALYIQTQTLEAEAAAQEDARQRSARAQEEAAQQAAKAAEEMATNAEKAAQDAMKPWDEALQDMAASIDSGFTQAWRDAFTGASDGFKNFASNMKDAFLNLLASMAHMALTRPIAIQIGTAMGGLVPGAASAGAGGTTPAASSITGGLSGLTSGITAAGKGLYSAIGTLTNDLGLFKVSNAFNAKAAATTGWSMAGDFAGGIAGKFAADKVFGETSGIGAGIGGVVGSAVIPIPVLGAAIGSFVGAGLEKAMDKVFGQKNDGSNRGMTDFDLATGANNARGIGKSFSQESVDAASNLANVLQQFATSIGGSSLKANITVGGKEGIKYGNQSFGNDAEAFYQKAFRDVIQSGTKVSDRLKPLIMGFNGSAEEIAQFATGLVELDNQVGGISDNLLSLIQNARGSSAEIVLFSQAIVSISQQAGINTVTNAIKEFTTVAPSAAVAYQDHTAELLKQISAFDGSASSAANLNTLLIENKTAAYQFAMAIQTIGQQLGIAAADQAQYIRQSVLTADQLRAARTAERDSLSAALNSMTNPEEIDKATKSILDLNRKIFDSLAEDQKLRRAEEFASYAENVNAIAQGLLQSELARLQTTQDDINTRTLNMLDGVADKYQQAADTNLDAANINQNASEKLAGAVNNLVTKGIMVNSRDSSEVDN